MLLVHKFVHILNLFISRDGDLHVTNGPHYSWAMFIEIYFYYKYSEIEYNNEAIYFTGAYSSFESSLVRDALGGKLCSLSIFILGSAMLLLCISC